MITGLRSTYGYNTVTPLENSYVLGNAGAWANDPSKANPPLILCHSASNNVDSYLYLPEVIDLLWRLGEYFTIAMCDFGGNTNSTYIDSWGNPTSRQKVETARLALANNYGATGPVTMLGISMGNLVAMNYTKAYPSNVRAIAGIIPAIDMISMRNQSIFTAPIDTAYGGTYTDATFGATSNPVLYAASLPNIPIKLFYSSTDVTTTPATKDAFVGARPSTMQQNIGTAGHSFESVAAAVTDAILFCRYLT